MASINIGTIVGGHGFTWPKKNNLNEHKMGKKEMEPQSAVQDSGAENIIKNKYKERLSFAENYNMAVFKIFSDYFNIIYQDKEKQKKDGVEMIGLLTNKFVDSIDLYSSLGECEVLIKFYGLVIKLNFCIFKSNGAVYYQLNFTSSEETNYKNSFIYSELFKRALKESELMGSYITMHAGSFLWELKPMEKRTMNDIYLPKNQIEDLEMYVDVYKNNFELLRYLYVGSPGTGKTEACLTLMNILKDMGVTIIKTPICKLLKDKIELAIMLRPSLLLFDDLDISLGSRSSGGYSNLLEIFLDVLDGTDKLPKDVGVLATTNSAALLDLAAQRPGRFDKVSIFDELTKENILNIILKSLKFNFKITNDKDTKVFTDKKIIDKFFSTRVTGAHIFNGISMMKLKYDMITKSKKGAFEISVNWLLGEIDAEIKILDKIKAQQKINDRLNNAGATKKIGLGYVEDEEIEVREESDN